MEHLLSKGEKRKEKRRIGEWRKEEKWKREKGKRRKG